MKRLLCVASLLVAFVALTPLAAMAAADAPKVDPKAGKVLRELSATIEQAKGFSVELTATLTAQPVNQTNTNVTNVVVDRAGRLAATFKEGEQGMTVVNDGKEMTI